MRKAQVFRNDELVGTLWEESRSSYGFRYDTAYFLDPTKPQISFRLPKSQQEYHSEILFPFFYNLLSEGANRKLQSRLLKIDEGDHFGFLLATAQSDTIGAITVKPITDHENS